ncbi:hypothetical protein PSTG_18650, partial [Puccinia striiformis f. sp. tritici PST-78]
MTIFVKFFIVWFAMIARSSSLSGAHNLGKCHTDRSGYEGPWVNNPTRFSNQYFRFLKNLEWKPKKWDGPLQFVNSDFGEELMMLP